MQTTCRSSLALLALLALSPTSRAQSILPSVDCVEQTEDGRYRGYFGYETVSADAVSVPLGHANRYQGGRTGDAPPTEFAPGVHRYAFEATFENRLTWVIETDGERRMVRADQRHPDYNDCQLPYDSDNEPGSDGALSLDGLSASSFNPAGPQALTVLVDGATFSPDPDQHQAVVNGAYLRPTSVAPAALRFDVALDPGRNEVSLYTVDALDLPIRARYVLWAGSATQTVTVTDASGAPLDGASVRTAIVDDLTVGAEGVTQGGTVVFDDVPPRTLIVTAEAAPNRFGTAGALGNGSPVTVVALGFDAPSAVDNNDFSLGLDGWDVTSGVTDGSVSLIPHQEEVGPDDDDGPTEEGLTLADGDLDLDLETGGEGPQRVSRAFTIEPGTRSVTVRYRFVTTEVPGGYYGTEFNDYFGVTVRSQTAGGRSSEQNSMNGLGLSSFDAAGATSWREVELPVSEDGDLVQVDLVVANVGDGAFPSRLVADRVREAPLAISAAVLKDRSLYRGALKRCHGGTLLENLPYLSMGNPIPVNNGDTWVWGDLTLEGEPGDVVTDVRLEAVLESGRVVNTGTLSSAAEGDLIQTFGSSGQLSTSQSGSTPLFLLPASGFPTSGVVALRARATTVSGQTTTRQLGLYRVLALYRGTNRFSGRDPDQGGDGWATIETRQWATDISAAGPGADLSFNDFANMNGGKFPIHCEHRTGDIVDVTFPLLPGKSAAAARHLVDILNTPLGRRVEKVQTTMPDGSTFARAIADAGTLDDGRRASAVVTHLDYHDTHMHVTLFPGGGALDGAALALAGPTGQAWTTRGPRTPEAGPAPAPLAATAPSDGPLAVAVAPNPTTGGRLAVQLSGAGDATIRAVVYDVVGRRVLDAELPATSTGALDIGALAPGTYVLRVSTGDETASVPFVVVR